jgi:hypothetical protein
MKLLKTVVGRAFLIVVISLVIIATSFSVWATATNPVMPEAERALMSDEVVKVVKDGFIAFEPQTSVPSVGYVLYPGGRVRAEAYAPLARAIAEQGYLVAIVYAPLNLAFFSLDAASDVIARYPNIARWAVGGHSLGGVAAAIYAENHPNVAGLVLMASYPANDALARSDALRVLSLYATQDGLASVDTVLSSAKSLPTGAQFVAIEGGNHAQFGWYGAQDGDKPASISRAEQMAQVVSATLDLLAELAQ